MKTRERLKIKNKRKEKNKKKKERNEKKVITAIGNQNLNQKLKNKKIFEIVNAGYSI